MYRIYLKHYHLRGILPLLLLVTSINNGYAELRPKPSKLTANTAASTTTSTKRLSPHVSGPSQDAAAELGFKTRAQAIINQTADRYDPPSHEIGDPEKYYWPKAMARFEKYGVNDTMGNRYIRMFATHPPFHFVLAGTSRLLNEYPTAPAIKAERLTFLRTMWDRKDSYNAWTSEGTENHINMSRTSGYLFAQAALDYPVDFPDAPAKLSLMKDWIKAWSKLIYQHGTGEWNTSIYTTYHIIGWLNVFDYAKDPEVKACARAVLDYYAAEMALHYSYGLVGGAELRGGGAGHSSHASTTWLGWLWFGKPDKRTIGSDVRGSEYIQCLHAITSDYRPPAVMVALADKANLPKGFYTGTRPDYHLRRHGFSKHFLYNGNGFTVGSATMPYGGWTGTTMQVMNWKMVSPLNGTELPAEVSGNGRFYDQWDGKTRNPFTQVLQWDNIIIQMTKTPSNVKEVAKAVIDTVAVWDRRWTHDFNLRFSGESHRKSVINYGKPQLYQNQSYLSFPKGQKFTVGRNFDKQKFWIAEVGQTYVVCLALNGKNIKIDSAKGRTVLIDNADLDVVCGFIVSTFNKVEVKSLEALKRRYSKTTNFSHEFVRSNDGNEQDAFRLFHFDAPDTQFTFQGTGKTEEALVDWGYGPTAPMVLIKSPPFTQPQWPSGKGGGRVGLMSMNLISHFHQMDTEDLPIATGYGINFSKSTLNLDLKGLKYRVDYTGEIPIFINP